MDLQEIYETLEMDSQGFAILWKQFFFKEVHVFKEIDFFFKELFFQRKWKCQLIPQWNIVMLHIKLG